MKSLLVLFLAFQAVVAFPAVLDTAMQMEARDAKDRCEVDSACDQKYEVTNHDINYNPDRPTSAQKASAARTNCGESNGPCTVFDAADQYVSTTGYHAYRSPTLDQIRGPCPGLNAAANHAYLPRTGVPTIHQTRQGLGKLYSMDAGLAIFLAAYAIAFDGDFLTMTWSIGGPQKTPSVPLLRQGQGISWSHNKYEGDSSIGRCDAYVNHGDAHSLSTQRFAYAYESGLDNDRYTLDKFSQAFTKNTIRSQYTNALYFAPLFSTTLVSPAAYNFVINFMSNRTKDEKSGYLNGHMFKKFFAIEGDYPNFKWLPGQERIPDNWYKRPTSQGYTIAAVFGDLLPEFRAYPKSFRFGGNTGGKGTYTGINIHNFTGGALNAKDLLEGDNFACFFFQNQQQAVPDQLKGGINDAAKAFKFLDGIFSDQLSKLSCKQIGKYDNDAFTPYPGRHYSPKPGKNAPTNC